MKYKVFGKICFGVLFFVLFSFPVFAYDSEMVRAMADFKEALRRNQFSAIEFEYSLLQRAGRRSAQGNFIADGYTDFSELIYCDRILLSQSVGSNEKLEALRTSCWEKAQSRLNDWQKSQPLSIFPIIGLSEIYISRAKSIKVGGVETMRLQEDYLRRAASVLDDVAEEKRDVIWYIAYMRVATAQGWNKKDFFNLLNKAAEKYPNHSKIYRQASFYYLPRNGGSASDLEMLAQWAVDKSKEFEGMSMYAHIYDEVMWGQGNYGETAWEKMQLSWPKMRVALQDIYSRFPEKWNLNRFAQHACVAHDFLTLKNLLDEIDSLPSGREDGWFAGESQRCRKLVERSEIRQPVINFKVAKMMFLRTTF